MLSQRENRLFHFGLRSLLFFAAVCLIAFELYEPKTKVHATTYDVLCPGSPQANGDSLRSAFDAASSGSTADTINLTAGCIYELDDSPLYSSDGNNGLDPINNDVAGLDLTINGNGATIRRAATATQNFRIMRVLSGAEVVINNVIISGGNFNSGSGFGGGISIGVGATVTINDSTVSSNLATVGGGGIDNSGTLTINRSTFSGNNATGAGGGGGIYNFGAAAVLNVNNSTISGNTASLAAGPGGGGIFVNNGTVNISSSTITDNTSGDNDGQGAGLHRVNGTITVRNSIITNNRANGVQKDCGEGLGSPFAATWTGNNLVGSGGSIQGCNGGPAIAGTSASVISLTLGNNGGPTQTHSLAGGGPAINLVTNTTATPNCTFIGGGQVTTDQRGTARPALNAGSCDAGAFEVLTNSPPTSVSAGGAYTISEGNSLTLSGSATDPNSDPLTYSWDVNGDGTFGDATGANPTLTWPQLNALGINDGPATINNVKVRVSDGVNPAVDSAATSITVNNSAPTLTISGAPTTVAGSIYTLNLSSSDPGNDTISSWAINWGDGSPVQTVSGNPSSVTHTYAAANNNTISATATDEDGTYAAGNTVSVSVTPACTTNPVVMSTNDSGAGSLRQAVIDACTGDTISFDTAGVFATPQTISLISGEIVINKNLTITGTGASSLTVSGSNTSRIFSLSSGFTINISGLTLTGGKGVGTINNNNGGAIINSGATLNISSTIISGNSVTGSGGAIYTAGSVTLTDSTISGNTASSFGGGIRVINGSLNVTRSTISGNTTNASLNAGGGIDSSTGITVTNSTISGNSATGSIGSNGGGIWVSLSSTITNCTITNNSAAGANSAGGILLPGNSITVRNTIIAANQNNATTPDVLDLGPGSFSSSGYNLIGNVGTVTTFNQPTDQTGTGASPLNPRLAPLAFNGGTTQTHRLLPHSPAIDNGAAANHPVTSAPITTDQRGLTRPVDLSDSIYPNASSGDGSDIGAFESQTLPVKVPLDFDGDGKSDYAVVQGTFPRPGGEKDTIAESDVSRERDETIKDVRPSGDLLAYNNQRFWTAGYNKLLHLRAGRGFVELPKDVQSAQASWEKEQGTNNPVTEGGGSLNWLIRKSSDGSTLNYSLGANTDEFVPADYDGDGKTDAAVWNPVSGFTVIQSSTLSPVIYPLGVGNMNANPTVVGDYDGDGIDDPAVYDSTTGLWTWLGGSSHTTVGSATWMAGGIPAPGDYNGDGKMDFAVQLPPNASPDTAKFRIAFNDGSVGPASDIAITYGLAVYAIVPGDYDGDGKTDIAQVNMMGSVMGWRYLTSSSNYTLQVKRNFGVVSTDRSVQGDYDGDGKIDLAIYRRGISPDDGVFIVFQSSTSTQTAPFDWGDVDDYPIGFYNSH